MTRCLELAKLGAGFTAPNPMVGAILVYEDRIIGEGYHRQYGQAHAEVNCIDSVQENDRHVISSATMYVSLEPCAHYGKTPPCADLIIRHKIAKCIIGCRDPFKEVSGKGIEKLKAAGVEVETGILEKESIDLNKRFFTFHTKHRPYIILKWAQTANGLISSGNKERLLISNEYSNRLVHKWRSEEASILVGTNTALCDNPELTTRLWPGPSPIRLVIDMDLKLPVHLKLFDATTATIIFNTIRHDEQTNPAYYQVTHDTDLVHQLCNALYQMKIQSVLVEGGARLLQSFIDAGVWDEARLISNQQLFAGKDLPKGLPAPMLTSAVQTNELKLLNDTIQLFKPSGENS